MISRKLFVEVVTICEICEYTALTRIPVLSKFKLYFKFHDENMCKECYNSTDKENRKGINSLEIDYYYLR